MSRIQRKRPEPVSRPAGRNRELAHSVRRQIAFAAGTEFFQHRDPLYHVTESFQQAFDAIGRAKTPEDTGSEKDIMLRCFSANAFQRGLLSGAVLRGTGKMMLVSCLKKTAGQLEPENIHQRKLFERGGAQRNIPGGFPNRVVFNRGFAKSAVGLVVDVLFDARSVVENMCALIEKGDHEGGDTLRAMYPFLDDRRERQLLEQYYAGLKNPEGITPDERAVLQAAIEKTGALKAKKAQMKQELIDRLRHISKMAAKAIEEFTDPEFIPEEAAGENEEPTGDTEETSDDKKPIFPIIPIIDHDDHDDEGGGGEDGAGGRDGDGTEGSGDAPGAREDGGEDGAGGRDGDGTEGSGDAPGAREDGGEEEPSNHSDVPPDETDHKPKRRRRGFFIPVRIDGGEKEEENKDESLKDAEPEPANLGEEENGTTDPEPDPADTADRSGDAQDSGP